MPFSVSAFLLSAFSRSMNEVEIFFLLAFYEDIFSNFENLLSTFFLAMLRFVQ